MHAIGVPRRMRKIGNESGMEVPRDGRLRALEVLFGGVSAFKKKVHHKYKMKGSDWVLAQSFFYFTFVSPTHEVVKEFVLWLLFIGVTKEGSSP